MKTRIKRLWVDALRSGQYRQGTHGLRLNTKAFGTQFCCLGVLCNLHAQAHPEIASTQIYEGSYLGEAGLLPREVMKWAGLQTRNGMLPEEVGNYSSLTQLNDSGKWSFDAIAHIIDTML